MSFLNLGSIRNHLAFLILLTVLPAMSILLYSGMEQRRNSIEDTEQEVLLITNAMGQVQKDMVLSAREVLSTVALMTEVHDLNVEESNDIFKNFLKRNLNYKNIALIDLNGYVIASGIPIQGLNIADRKHVSDALRTSAFATGEYAVARLGNPDPVFAFAYPVLDATGTLKAVLSLAIKLTAFSELYSQTHLPDNFSIAVLDHQGIYLLRSPVKEIINPIKKPIKGKHWKIASQAQEPGIITAAGLDGINRIFAFEQIRLNANTAPYMYIWASVPEAFIFAPANSILKRNVLLMLLAATGALFVSWVLGRKVLITPINKLISMTSEFAKGNLENRIEQTYTIDEFRKLTVSFYDMAEALSTGQKKLQDSEDRFKKLSGVTFEGIIIHKEGSTLDVNESLLKLFGYTWKELIGTNMIDLFFPCESYPIVHEKVLKHITTPYEVMAITKDRTLFPVEIESRNITEGNDHFRVTAIRDISDRKQADIALIKAANDWQAGMDVFEDVICLLDNDRHIVRANTAFYAAMETTTEQAIGSHFAKIIHPNKKDDSCPACLAQEEKRDFSMVMEANDENNPFGRPLAVMVKIIRNDDGASTGILMNFHDLTHSRQDEEKLRDSELKFRLLADYTYDWESWINPQGEYVYMSPSCERVTGYTPAEFISSPQLFFDLVSPVYREAVQKHYSDDNSDTISAHMMEFPIIIKTGEERWIAHHCCAVFDEQGQYAGRRSNNRDITVRKQAEVERLELESELRQKYKMDSVGVMAGGMAHNFNNNLSIILGNIELSKMNLSSNKQVNDYLSDAKVAVLRSRDMIQQIMTYSRKGSLGKVSTQLALSVDETLTLLRSTIPSSVNVRKNINSDSRNLSVNADPSQIQECLINLCNNAMHAMEEEGELTISLETVELQKQDIPAQYDCKPGLFAKLSVQDDGSGMAAETVDKIFDLFYTTKPVGKGTGIGLSTVLGILKHHCGLIKVNSTLGEGTSFELYFPVIEQPLIAEAKNSNADQPEGTERILFIDDDDMLAKLGEKILTRKGYQVTMMTESTEALKMFAANADRFQLVITDQTMPDLTGKELIPKLREIKSDIPIILCTGFSSKINQETAKKLGINAFMMKPLDIPELLQTIRQVLDVEKE